MLNVIILILLLLWALLVLFLVTSELIAYLRTRVPFVPTRHADIKFIAEKCGIKPSDIFYDLGSGNGKVVFAIHELTGASCVGYELSWWTYLYSQIRLKIKDLRFKPASILFRNQNFFKQPWTEANFIYGYLYPPLMGRVEEKFLADCQPGAVAIIRDFPFPNLKPVEVHYRPHKHEIYIYRKV